MKTIRYWTICSFLTILSSADDTVWAATCFEESYTSGRTDIVDALEISVTSKTEFDGIAKATFGDESRVAFLNYCTEATTNYIESIQIGITNGAGSQTQW